MINRCGRLGLLVGVWLSTGAAYQTANFVVEAPTPQAAEQIGKWAEHYRKEKSLLWTGREMPPWQERCPIKVKITQGGAGGATSFNFTRGMVWQSMTIEGPLDRLVHSVLPHEVTHTVFAHYFRNPVPRWADEGGAVLSEDDLERNRHDIIARQLLSAGRAMPLARLFSLREYPSDTREIGTLYAEGYSVVEYLVSLSGRKQFLDFVGHGMTYDWDSAAQTHFRFQNVQELEKAWINSLRTRRPGSTSQPSAVLVSNQGGAQVDPTKRVVTRITAPPSQPFAEAAMPVIRAQAAEESAPGWYEQRPRDRSRPEYLPASDGGNRGKQAAPQDTAGVKLGSPQFAPMPLSGRQAAPGYPK